NTLLMESSNLMVQASQNACGLLEVILKRRGFISISQKTYVIVSDFLTNSLISFIVRGVYSAKQLPSNDFIKMLHKFLDTIDVAAADRLKTELGKLYGNTIEYGRKLAAELIKRRRYNDKDIDNIIRQQFILVSDKTVEEIKHKIISE
ncbi:MAG: hypothetical protein K2O54_00035, partial [Prevotella sp.]|nr:hypothetical protein [Prevotella sp.]